MFESEETDVFQPQRIFFGSSDKIRSNAKQFTTKKAGGPDRGGTKVNESFAANKRDDKKKTWDFRNLNEDGQIDSSLTQFSDIDISFFHFE